MKQLTPDPWADIQTKYPGGSQHKGIVRNFTNFGVFVELEEGIDGLIHISDLSWTKKIKHPSEFTSIGAELEVKVLDVDTENRRLSLGHKQVQENPWDNYAAVFTVGSSHEGNVIDVFDKGANIMFETYGVEGFCPGRHTHKEDGTQIKKGETLEFKVIEFSKDARRIVVSHTQLHKDMGTSAEDIPSDDNAKASKSRPSKKASQNVEKTTLGDLDALAQLKKDMEDGE